MKPAWIIGGVVLIALFFILWSMMGGSSKYVDFATCVSNTETILYSAWWCPHCAEQKSVLGSAFKILEESGTHIECGGIAQGTFNDYCKEVGVGSVPMWKFTDGTNITGFGPNTLNAVSAKTGCALP